MPEYISREAILGYLNDIWLTIDTATGMTPNAPVERENMKMLMRMTNERLNEAVTMAEAILSDIRGAFPRKDDEGVNVSSAMDAARLNRDTAHRLCCTLKEIALQMGVEA